MAQSMLPAWSKTLYAATTIAADTNVDFTLPVDVDDLKLIMVVTSPTGTTETLDASFLTSWDGGTNYVMHSRFAQVTTSAATRVLDIQRAKGKIVGQEFASATTGGADANAGAWAEKCRVTLDVGGTNPGYTVALYAVGNLNH